MFVCFVAFAQVSWGQTSTRKSVDLPNSPGYTLQPGNMYIVQSSMTITATHGNGLNVAAKDSKQAPILYLPAGVTLTVKGANSNGIAGGGAGIYVPSGAELIITGAGTLNATGGDAGAGTNGSDGKNPGDKDNTTSPQKDFARWQDELGYTSINMNYSGAGGNGGNGGGGAGAGIGGTGGNGGAGGAGAKSVSYFNNNNNTGTRTAKDGIKGDDGSNGSYGTAMGKVYVWALSQ